ncbi:hypothetical protein ACEU2D_25470 [Brevibacillus laterosporus]|uniref:hypothetical protein n=1 Tax=Brevibacillus laterosporus TaxID=1465 RepID=UPI0035A6FDDC
MEIMITPFITWLKEEDGFEVFERSVLTKGGIIIAIGVGSIILSLTGGEYTHIENEFIGSEEEVDETLRRFH